MSNASIPQNARSNPSATKARELQNDQCPTLFETASHYAGPARETLQRVILHDLSTVERLLVLLWYVERMNPVEVALALDLTESQAVSIHDRIVSRMRSTLRIE